MSKQPKKKRGGASEAPEAPKRRIRRPRLFAALLVACALLTAGAATRLNPVRRLVGLRPLTAPAARQGESLGLAKEYIYAGGRLVATEEPTPTPTPTPPGASPSALVATASFPSSSTAVVMMTWSAPSTGSPTGYVVERASTRSGGQLQYAELSPPATSLPTEANPYVDQNPPAGAVSVYRVKAVYAGGFSGYSNQELATTVRYTGDDPLIRAYDPQGRPASKVRALDLTELRDVVEAVRTLAGVGPATWKGNPSPLGGGSILAEHFGELRVQLNPALDALGINQISADASAIAAGQPVKAAHIQDVREKVR